MRFLRQCFVSRKFFTRLRYSFVVVVFFFFFFFFNSACLIMFALILSWFGSCHSFWVFTKVTANDSKSPRLSRILQSFQADFNSVVVGMVSILPIIFGSHGFFRFFYYGQFFPPMLANGLFTGVWETASLQSFSEYTRKSQQCCGLDNFNSSIFFIQALGERSKCNNYYWYHRHPHIPQLFHLSGKVTQSAGTGEYTDCFSVEG